MMIKSRLRLPGLVLGKEAVCLDRISVGGWLIFPPEGFLDLERCSCAVHCLPSFLVISGWRLSSWAAWRQHVLGIASGGDGCSMRQRVLGIASGGDGCSMPSSATLAETSSEPPGFRGGRCLDAGVLWMEGQALIYHHDSMLC